MTQYGFFYDESRCVDCRACSISCRDWNGLEPGDVKYLRRFTWEEGVFPELSVHSLFVPCYHCEKPACVNACPTGACFKEDKYGAVLVDKESCIGCEACYEACPYGCPRFRDNVMKKCTMCIDRLENGDMPACVNSCIVRALDFGPIEELREKYGDIEKIEGMPDPSMTKPAVTFKPVEPKKQIVPLDPNKVRELFGQRAEISPLYETVDVFGNIEEGAVRANKLDLKLTEEEERRTYVSKES